MKDKKNVKLTSNDLAGLQSVYAAFVNNGTVFDEKAGELYELGFNDLITSETMARFVPMVVTTIVREAIEPILVVEKNLFQNVTMETGSQIEIGSLGAIRAAEIAQNQEYPTADIQVDGGYMVSFDVTKKGIMVPVTKEVIDDNLFDIVALWLRGAGRAMARLSEELAVKTLLELGVLMHSNIAPTNSILGNLTGRNIAGDGNGSMSMNDMFRTVAEQMMRGFNPDHLLISPLAWVMFATDPEIREIMFSGQAVTSEAMPGGNASQGWGTTHGGYGLRTIYHGSQAAGPNPWLETPNPLQATWQIMPKGLPAPLTALVSPFMPYNATGGSGVVASGLPTTNIALVDSKRAGVRLNRQGIEIDEWNDPKRDVRNIKLCERYGHAILEMGKGVAIDEGVVLAKNYVFENMNAVSLAQLDRTTVHAT